MKEVTIKVKISSCKHCPFFKMGITESTDGFDSGNDWFCAYHNDGHESGYKIISGFVEWHEVSKIEIPDWCPAKI